MMWMDNDGDGEYDSGDYNYNDSVYIAIVIVISDYGDSYCCDYRSDANYENDTSAQILSKWIGMVVVMIIK